MLKCWLAVQMKANLNVIHFQLRFVTAPLPASRRFVLMDVSSGRHFVLRHFVLRHFVLRHFVLRHFVLRHFVLMDVLYGKWQLLIPCGNPNGLAGPPNGIRPLAKNRYQDDLSVRTFCPSGQNVCLKPNMSGRFVSGRNVSGRNVFRTKRLSGQNVC